MLNPHRLPEIKDAHQDPLDGLAFGGTKPASPCLGECLDYDMARLISKDPIHFVLKRHRSLPQTRSKLSRLAQRNTIKCPALRLLTNKTNRAPSIDREFVRGNNYFHPILALDFHDPLIRAI